MDEDVSHHGGSEYRRTQPERRGSDFNASVGGRSLRTCICQHLDSVFYCPGMYRVEEKRFAYFYTPSVAVGWPLSFRLVSVSVATAEGEKKDSSEGEGKTWKTSSYWSYRKAARKKKEKYIYIFTQAAKWSSKSLLFSVFILFFKFFWYFFLSITYIYKCR